ncbi:ascorbate-dependent peroxidase [Angomonas deanei]|uniref:Cytochrome c peroxidase, mitochondrial n=1 Tax=Angomonas deanei TaxID=59799 RepID=A0A7G2CD85_9TRYP|nr:ascorbate-dependent peroxidase [Angomonas deanei]CAD2216981.1 Peroxidase, putative [Angomonas deanei]|eukprot:EPY43626.1 ascorbate-dependent peroxidase [Angomonas deanei]
MYIQLKIRKTEKTVDQFCFVFRPAKSSAHPSLSLLTSSICVNRGNQLSMYFKRFVGRSLLPSSRVSKSGRRALYGFGCGAALGGATVWCWGGNGNPSKPPFDIKAIRRDIEQIVSNELELGPAFIRLAWHEAGSWDCKRKDGSPNSASMRFAPECDYEGNRGLDIPRNALEALKKKYPEISYADLWVLAAYVAIEYMGGPAIPFSWGRQDAKDGSVCGPDGRLPDASKTQDHVRDVFTRLGFTDKEAVALIGAHTCGECHLENSGVCGSLDT